ncbi:MAG: hypothetical protein KY053_00660 [Candidatus Liptonbacteria bacterium]|nr:hypothetical protein [Candidatus Liptonbacteria bacterium]
MEYINRTILKILNDFKDLDYEDFLSKYSKIIKWSPSDKPDLIVLYSILNNGAKASIVYDTTNNFMDIRQIENIYKKGNIENETRN